MYRYQIVMENPGGELDRREAETAHGAAVALAQMVTDLRGNVEHGDTFRIIDTQAEVQS